MIDTLKFAKNFEFAGFAKPQAEALTAALAEMTSLAREDLVTKSDLQVAVADLRTDIRSGDAALRGEMGVLRGDLGAKIADVRTQLMWAMLGSQFFVLGAFVAIHNFTNLLK